MVLIALVFVVIGVVFAGIGIGFARSSRRFEATAARARATVTDVRSRAVGRGGGGGGLVLDPGRALRDPRRAHRRRRGRRRHHVKQWEPGQALDVSYDPANPADVRVPGSGGGLIQAVFIGIGVLFALLGLLLGARSSRSARCGCAGRGERRAACCGAGRRARLRTTRSRPCPRPARGYEPHALVARPSAPRRA